MEAVGQSWTCIAHTAQYNLFYGLANEPVRNICRHSCAGDVPYPFVDAVGVPLQYWSCGESVDICGFGGGRCDAKAINQSRLCGDPSTIAALLRE
eukprot:SAG31_NODE_17335_length_674_cov_1.766957_1_plen_94_part_10